MNIRPAGFYDFSDDDEEASECESGFSENSEESAAPAPTVRLQTAIQQAALDEVTQLLQELADQYAGTTLENGLRPLVYAASLGNAQLVELLLGADAQHQVAAEAYAAYTPLMAVCSGFRDDYADDHESRLECVRLLLAGGHEAGFRDRYGETALMRACKSAPVAIVETLLQAGARLNEADNEGWTPLFYATSRGDLQLVEYLLAAGADATKADKRNRYPHMIAMEKGFDELVDLLTPQPEHPVQELASLTKRPSIFDAAEDGRYCAEVLEMVDSVSATSKRNVTVFAERRLELRDFLLLKTESQLKSLGVLFSGHRKKIVARVKQFHLGCWSPESFGLADRDGCGLLMQTLNFVATLHRQLYVLRASLEYVRPDLEKLSAEERAVAAQVLCDARSDLLRLNERLAALKRKSADINAESRPYLTAQEIVD